MRSASIAAIRLLALSAIGLTLTVAACTREDSSDAVGSSVHEEEIVLTNSILDATEAELRHAQAKITWIGEQTNLDCGLSHDRLRIVDGSLPEISAGGTPLWERLGSHGTIHRDS